MERGEGGRVFEKKMEKGRLCVYMKKGIYCREGGFGGGEREQGG